MEVGKSFECGVEPSNSNSLDNTPDFAFNFFSFNPVDLEAEGVSVSSPQGNELRNSNSNEGAVVDNDVVINGEGVSSKIDENGSPEIVKTRSGRIVKSTQRQDSLYY